MPVIWALCLIGGTIAVQVEEIDEVNPDEAQAVAVSVTEAIATRTASVVRLEDPVWWGCEAHGVERCLEESASRAGAEEVVSLRLLGSVRAVRVLARRVRGRDLNVASANVDIERGASDRAARASTLANALYPQLRSTPRLLGGPPPAEPPRASAWPLVLAGTAVVAAGVGTGFALSSAGARAELESAPQPYARFDELSGRFEAHRAVAIGGFIGAGIAGLAAAVLWWAEPGGL